MFNLSPNILYDKLLTYYGPQNWWPGEGFEIAIGAILTQNTSWKNVEIAIENLREYGLLTPERIVESSIEVLKELIKPSGFFNQKAEYLKELSKFWIVNSNPTREELLSIKGIGEETADSILLYLLQKMEFVSDNYTVRISTRLGFGEEMSKSYWKSYYQKNLPKEITIYNELHALFVVHGKNFCSKKNPSCSICFLLENCDFGKRRTKNSI
ncbi:MAG: endonuclease III domain-containing protein [Candidatus Thorarchaeota archaeon]